MIPIRRGTAQRLGLRHPPPDLVVIIEPDLSAFCKPRPVRLPEPLATLVRVRASFEEFTRQVKEAP